MPGDDAVITSGTVTVLGVYLQRVLLEPQGSSSFEPTLNLVDSTIDPTSTLNASNTAPAAGTPLSINTYGGLQNEGRVVLTGARFAITSASGPSGNPAAVVNTGAIDTVNGFTVFAAPSGATATLENDNTIASWNPNATLEGVVAIDALTGTGVMQVNPNSLVDLAKSVGPGQTIDFTGSNTPTSTLQLDSVSTFQGTISGFTANDKITAVTGPATGFSYASTVANSGDLVINNGGITLARLHFLGTYQQSDFQVSNLNTGQGSVNITTTATPAQTVNFTNVSLGLSSTDTGSVYTGPVAGLQRQYIWLSPDAVALSATTPNMFIKGGQGGDALAVVGGVNVLDGGPGSNFLVGGTGAGSQDTFFVDGRGDSVTWSTIVNFHQGDAATIFGFHPGTSTMPYTLSDGAAGFTGLTIHSELNGAGSGVNGSITFTGLDKATADTHFSITSGTLNPGTANAIDYLLIQYNR